MRGIMKSEDYLKILDENLSVQNLYLVPRLAFQEDNHLKHTSLQKNKIIVLLWPSKSRDKSLIENLWKQLKVQMNRHRPKNLQELERAKIEEWKAIAVKTCSNLIKNFGKRLQQVIKMRVLDIGY